jgi:hypothetical protein
VVLDVDYTHACAGAKRLGNDVGPIRRRQPTLAHVVLRLDLDASSRVERPLDRAQLRRQHVVFVEVDFARLEDLPERPVVLGATVDEPFLIDERSPAVVRVGAEDGRGKSLGRARR